MEKQPASLMARLVSRARLAPFGRVRELSEALARAERRNADLKRELDAHRDEGRELKVKVRELRERVEAAHNKGSDLAKKYEARAAELNQKTERERERLRERDAGRAERIEDVRKRMAWAEKSTQLGREHLMAIEVKLDLVEGAIGTLDQRTRAALAAARQRTDPEGESVRSR